MPGRVLVIADSLAFHGPEQPELLTHPGLYPNVLARELGAHVDCIARLGWTARDAWWALTKDPYVYSVLLPAADALVLGVGGMDHLPASIPTYLREGIARVRPAALRRPLRRTYHAAHPYLVRLWGGRLRMLPQQATEAYLSRCAGAVRHYHPDTAIVAIAPAPFDAESHPVNRHHAEVRRAALAWSAREAVPMLDVEDLVLPTLRDGTANPDGMHWGWAVHEQVGRGLAQLIRAASDAFREDRGEIVRPRFGH